MAVNYFLINLSGIMYDTSLFGLYGLEARSDLKSDGSNIALSFETNKTIDKIFSNNLIFISYKSHFVKR
jgi:hypothetical protein